MANFDPNRWYQIYLKERKVQSLAGTNLYDNNGGAVFLQNTNTTHYEQQWQVFPFNETYYVLRTRWSGATGYLHASFSEDENTPGHTVPDMRGVKRQDNSMFWSIDPWGDGTFYLTNAANQSDWHLNVKDNGLMSLSSNITKPQDGQAFSFQELSGRVDDVKYSSVVLPAAMSSTQTLSPSRTTSPPSRPSSSKSKTTSSGLSSGAKAGIGASIGGIAAVALLILAWFLMRRRKQRQNRDLPPAYPSNSNEGRDDMKEVATGSLNGKSYQKVRGHDPNELDAGTGTGPGPVELPSNVQSVELPTSRVV